MSARELATDHASLNAMLSDLQARISLARRSEALDRLQLDGSLGAGESTLEWNDANGFGGCAGYSRSADESPAQILAQRAAVLTQAHGNATARAAVRDQVRQLPRALRTARTSRRRMQWDREARGELSPDRLYGGRADTPFRAPGRRDTPAAPRVRILAQGAAAGGVEPEEMAQRGAAVAALASELYAAGYRISVTACYVGRCTTGPARGSLLQDTVRLVQEGERIDIDRLADVLASPFLFRGLLLAARKGQGSYGSRTVSIPDELAAGFDVVADAEALDDAAGWLQKQREALGIA